MRYLLASVPYRKKLNFTFDGLKAAATSIDRLRNYKLRLETGKFAEGVNVALADRAVAAMKAFDDALDDDLNTAEALGAMFDYVRDTNTAMDAGEFLAGNLGRRVAFSDPVRFRLRRAEDHPLVGKNSPMPISIRSSPSAPPPRKPVTSRAPTRSEGDWPAMGIVLEDTKEGVRWKRQ